MMCGEKRAQVWMERNKGKIKMTFIYIHIFFALKIQSYSYSFHAMPTNTNTVLLPCAFDMVSNSSLNLRYCVKKAELQQENLACLHRIC